MPIKTKIEVGADSAKIKESLATFEKYKNALEKMYGGSVLKAPHIQAASAAGGDLLKFIDLESAARTQSIFAAGSSKAARLPFSAYGHPKAGRAPKSVVCNVQSYAWRHERP
jgi:hypothetical protein